MDERTRRPDDEAMPKLRRAPPAPSIDRRRRARMRIGVGLIVLVGLAVAAYEFVPLDAHQAARPARGGNTASGGRRRNDRTGRHQGHRQRARHRHPDRHRHRADADQRPTAGGRVHRRAVGQEGRFPGADRSAALPASAGAIRRPARARSGPAGAGASRPRALPETRRAEFDRAPAIRGSDLHRAAVPGHGEARSGADRSAEAQRALLPHRLAGHRPRRPSPHRSGKLRADQQQHRHRGGHADAADHGDLSDPRGRPAADRRRN